MKERGWEVFWAGLIVAMALALSTLLLACHGEETLIKSMAVPEISAPEEPEDPERESAEERDPVEEPVELEKDKDYRVRFENGEEICR